MTHIKLSYTSPKGGFHEDAMWFVRRVHLDVLLGSGTYEMEGYQDQSYVDAVVPFTAYSETFSSPPVPTNTSAQNIALIYQHELDTTLAGGTLVS